MQTMYVVMIQNDEYPQPEICLNYKNNEAGTYKYKSDALNFIISMADKGYDIHDYFIAELNRVGE